MADAPGLLDHLIPDDPLMAGAWVAALRWAIGEPDALAEFREATGNAYQPPTNPLDRAIDEATGADAAFVLAFAEWFDVNVWGALGDDEEGEDD